MGAAVAVNPGTGVYVSMLRLILVLTGRDDRGGISSEMGSNRRLGRTPKESLRRILVLSRRKGCLPVLQTLPGSLYHCSQPNPDKHLAAEISRIRTLS
jgi:hypothetical protein